MAVITASPKNFVRLIELQETANQNLHTIKTILELSRDTQLETLVKASREEERSDKQQKVNDDSLDIEKENLRIQKEQLQLLKDSESDRKQAQEVIQKVMDGMKSFKSPLERMRDTMKSITSKFSGENIKKKLLETTNIMGVNNKSIERQTFIKEQKALGSTESSEELRQKFEGAYSTKKESSKVEEKIQALRQATGGKFTDEELAKSSKENASLFSQKGALAEQYSQFDRGAQLKLGDKASMVSPAAPAIGATPTSAFATAGSDKETAQENAKLMGNQTSLLEKIEENTRGGTSAASAPSSASAGEGGGLLGGLGKGLKSLGSGVGAGLGSILSGLGKGLRSLAIGLVALTPAIPVIGVLTLATMGLGAALNLAAPAIEAFAPVLVKVADVIQNVFVATLEKIPEIVQMVGAVVMSVISTISDSIIAIIDTVISSIERLSAIDGSNLLSVGAGLVAVAAGMAAFGAGSAVAGVGNLVGGLLGAITPGGSPVDQIIKLGASGPNIEKAGIGVEKLAAGLKAFSAIDSSKIKALAALPVDKIAAMGAAMGNAGVVEGKSAQNRSLNAQSSGASTGNTSVVAPTINNTTRQNNIIRSPIRNQEGSVNSYIRSRYATQ